MSFVSNLVGFTKKSDLPKLGKSFTYNMYVETKDAGEHAFNTILKPMPGYSQLLVLDDSTPNARGMYKVSRGHDGKPKVYGVWGSSLYLVTETNYYKIGTLSNNSGHCTFAETSGYGNTHPHLCICDGNKVFAVDTTLDNTSQSQDFREILLPYCYPDQAPNRISASWICYLYGYLIVGQNNSDIFYTSYQYPFESVDDDGNIIYDIFMAKADNEETAGYGKWTMSEWQPDNTLIGCSNGSRLFTFGERSFQVFTYQSSQDTPFASPDTASKNIGIKNKNSLALFGDNTYWLGSSDMGSNIVYAMGADANPVRISTDEIEAIIDKCDKSAIQSCCFLWHSHPFYILNFTTSKTTIVYDIKEKGWFNLGSRLNDGTEGCWRYSYAQMNPDGGIWLQCYGKMVEACEPKLNTSGLWEGNWFEHDDTPILRKRAGGMLSVDHKPFKIGSIKLLMNNGDFPLILDRAPLITMRYSSDGVTWKNTGTYSLGKVGQYDYDIVFRHLGKVTFMTIEVGSSENIGFALYGMEVNGISCKK